MPPQRVELAPTPRVDVIYDGKCDFCARSLRFVQAIARRDVFRLHDANERDLIRSRFPILANADMDEAMLVVAPNGEVSRGFFAFRRMMRASPWLYPYLVLFYLPGASLVGPAIYAWVARHRHRLGCSASCELQPPSRRPDGEQV